VKIKKLLREMDIEENIANEKDEETLEELKRLKKEVENNED